LPKKVVIFYLWSGSTKCAVYGMDYIAEEDYRTVTVL